MRMTQAISNTKITNSNSRITKENTNKVSTKNNPKATSISNKDHKTFRDKTTKSLPLSCHY